MPASAAAAAAAAAAASLPASTTAAAEPADAASPPAKKTAGAPEKKYKCQFCNRAFSRSEHRSRHERSHTKERPFKCMKCRSTFVRRDLLLRHDRTVHAKDGGVPLVSEVKRRAAVKAAAAAAAASGGSAGAGSKDSGSKAKGGGGGRSSSSNVPVKPPAPPILDPATLEQIEASSDGMVDAETAAMLITDLHHKASASQRNGSGGGSGGGSGAGGRRRRNVVRNDRDDDNNSTSADMDHDHDRDHNNDTPASPPAYSPEHTTMFDGGVQYLGGAGGLPLPQMPWDPFVSHSLSFNSSHSHGPSSVPHHHGAAGSDTLGPGLHPMDGSLPVSGAATPNGGRSGNNNGGGRDNNGGAGGRGLSPFPFLVGPVSPVDYRRSPGPSQALSQPKIPQVTTDEEFEAIVERMRALDADGGGGGGGGGGEAQQATSTSSSGGETTSSPSSAAGALSSRKEVNEFLSTYFTLFHHHLPFLHPESFRPAEVSVPLLLAVLSIGALYAFRQDRAYVLHIGSKALVNQFLQNKESFSSRKCPLWTMQSTLVNMIFASWSGDAKGLEWACSIKSLLANMVAGNRYELSIRTDAREGRHPTRAEWIEDEGCRRTYYAVYIFFGLLTLSYNHTPAISFNEFDSLELPSSESLWNLEQPSLGGSEVAGAEPEAAEEEREAAWRETLAASMISTVREAHDALFRGEAVRYSAFATRVMISALFLAVWSHKRSFESLQDVVTEYKLRLALETWDRSLELCEAETIVVQMSAPHSKGHPLIFNALAVYRNARARLEVDLKVVQEALRYHDSYEVAAAMSGARDRVKRSKEMIHVVEECLDAIEVVALPDGLSPGGANGNGNGNGNGNNGANGGPHHHSHHQHLHGGGSGPRSNGHYYPSNRELLGFGDVSGANGSAGEPGNSRATNWSVEHPLCGMDLMVILSLWLYRLEHDEEEASEEELAMYHRVRNLLDDGDDNISKLGATVARLWGGMLDEEVVWGITKVMGESFRLHAQALVGYEDAMESVHSGTNTPTASSAAAPELEIDTPVY